MEWFHGIEIFQDFHDSVLEIVRKVWCLLFVVTVPQTQKLHNLAAERFLSGKNLRKGIWNDERIKIETDVMRSYIILDGGINKKFKREELNINYFIEYFKCLWLCADKHVTVYYCFIQVKWDLFYCPQEVWKTNLLLVEF